MLFASEAATAGSVAWLVVVLCVVVALLAVFVAALVSVLRAPGLGGAARAVWVVAVLVFPLLGPLAWFFAGRRAVAPA